MFRLPDLRTSRSALSRHKPIVIIIAIIAVLVLIGIILSYAGLTSDPM